MKRGMRWRYSRENDRHPDRTRGIPLPYLEAFMAGSLNFARDDRRLFLSLAWLATPGKELL